MRAAVCVLLLLATVPACAAGLRDLEDAWLLPPWPPAGPVPAAGPRWTGWCAAGSGRLYEMPELGLRGLSAGLVRETGPGAWFVRVDWQVLGQEIYREQRGRCRLGFHGTWRGSLELIRETRTLAGRAGPAWTAGDLVLGLARDLGGGARLVVDLQVPLVAAPAGPVSRARPVARILLGAATASLAAFWDRRPDGTPLPGGELALTPGPGASLLLRYDGHTGSLGPGLAIRRGGFVLRTSHVAHPDLGISHRFQLVAGGRTARWPAPGP